MQGFRRAHTKSSIEFTIYNRYGNIEQIWRPWSDISLGTPYDIISAGVAIDDIDYDGDADIVFMGIMDHPQGNTFYVRFGVNGRVSNGNDPLMHKNFLPNSALSITSDQPNTTESPIFVQNYPNPFNPITKIAYTITMEAYVKIDVYSVTGKLIKTLKNGNMMPGNHSVQFNATGFAGGIYFYRMQINGEVVATKKMLLLK